MKPEIKEKIIQNEDFWERLKTEICPSTMLEGVSNDCPSHNDCVRHWDELQLSKTAPIAAAEDLNYQLGELHSEIYEAKTTLENINARKAELEELIKTKEEKCWALIAQLKED